MSGAEAGKGVSRDAREPGRPQFDPGYTPGDGNKRGPTRGVLITIIGALITAGVATISPGLIGGERSGPPGGTAPVTSKAATTQQSCVVQFPPAPEKVTGRVTGLLTDEQAAAIVRSAEAQTGIRMNPSYPPLKHATVRVDSGSKRFETMAAIPPPVSVQIGDTVELTLRYRDPTLPCHFIPVTITRRIIAAR